MPGANAIANYLKSFSDATRVLGTELQRAGKVHGIHGNDAFVQAQVDDGESFKATLRGGKGSWRGRCTCPERDGCRHLYATLLEKMERVDDLPESPRSEPTRPASFVESLERVLARDLTDEEGDYVDKLERRYRRYEMDGDVYDHDLVRLHSRWPMEDLEPLRLWPAPPKSVSEYWRFIAYAFRKRNLSYPAFLDVIDDPAGTAELMREWERREMIRDWRRVLKRLPEPESSPAPRPLDLRLRVTINDIRLQSKWCDSQDAPVDFASLNSSGFNQLHEDIEREKVDLNPQARVLWLSYLQHAHLRESPARLDLDQDENGAFLNRLVRVPELAGSLVNLDDEPLRIAEERLAWKCREEAEAGNGDVLELVAGTDEEPVTHVVRALPGRDVLYLSDEAIFPGPRHWGEKTEVNPRRELPAEVVESCQGVEFLAAIGAGLPAPLAKRVSDRTMTATISCRVSQKHSPADKEHLLIDVHAHDESGMREETFLLNGWEVAKEQPLEGDGIARFDRRELARFPNLLGPLGLSFDAHLGCWRGRLTRAFPEKFHEWASGLPESIQVKADHALSSLLRDPVSASVRFEVEEEDIDWFDLRITLDIEGYDVSRADMRALVAARGGFVRMDDGGWLRLNLQLSDEQRNAVARLGIDPFDLSGETHRLHVLQLSDPAAKEVFDEAAWEKICERAQSLQLRVSPALPPGIKADLRPYQVEGYHFLSYLSSNRFGGILADDMGLGKTLQALTWMLWLRQNASEPLPCLVVCPKSVLDVWATEMDKFTPELRKQILRNKEELDMDRVKSEIDVLVINYAQLRGCAESLGEVQWLAAILDEGQQIKNPDSKAAKASRQLPARNRLVLTGTPIENRLLDIWSLMAFAMPGVLGNRKYFRDRFDRRKDALAQTRLSARLRPFLLRRTKSQVAVDLPPRTEEDVYCKLEGRQEELYNAELQRIKKILLGIEGDESLGKNTFVILQGLMRLRQICCHPALIDANSADEESAKFAALTYLLDQLRDEGHKVLVFSQFVTMLDIIRAKLEQDGHPFHYLTGQTRDRHEVIDNFQNSKDPSVFLLSLKAGGSGLNLTAASYVVLYDPWWNPAVEMQAIDRTHRIGQKSRVIAYRLLVRDSVEEKIRQLQQQKRTLVTGVLGEESFTRTLKREDLEFLFSVDE